MSTLGEIIDTLAILPADMVFPHGFAHPHSYRGYYDELAFEPATNTRAGDMLADAQAALGKTFTGYKGGDYEMQSWTDCWLAEYGDTGDSLSIGALVTIARLHAQAEALAAALEAVSEDASKNHDPRCTDELISGFVMENARVALRAYREARQ